MGIMIPIRLGFGQKGRSKAAFRGNLNCPVCQSTAIRYVEMIGPYRIRYRCRKCGMPFQYETGHDLTAHPYAPFKKNKWRGIVDKYNQSKGRTKKENKQ